LIHEADAVDAGRELECDVCIIGAGAAGITLAAELKGHGHAVILLESGGHAREAETQDLYAGETLGAPQYPLQLSRLRYLGGTTNHWAGTCRPFDAEDFEVRDWIPDSGWPIRRADLDAYYSRAHPLLDLGPNDYSEQQWPGMTAKGPLLEGERDIEFKLLQHSSPTTRFAQKFEPLLSSVDGPQVFLHANVEEIRAQRDGRTIETVAVRTLAGNRFSVRARKFVVAAGGIENARLLLLSDSVAPAGLGNDQDLVGRYFMDHPGALPFAVLVHLDPAYERIEREKKIDGVRILSGMTLTPEVRAREGLLASGMYMRRPMTIEKLRDFQFYNVIEVVKGNIDETDLEMIRLLDALKTEGSEERATLCWIRSEQAPNRDSRVTLGEDRDALGQRRCRLDWRLSELNHHTFRTAATRYAEVLTRAGVGRVRLMPWLLGDDTQWWNEVSPGWHHMGTTRMASDPQHGVVDANARVFGLDNLFVAGASVFATSSYVNPTLTLVALAIRLADHLKQELA
jgi:choline dehydrogenase-like flavoprotein